MPEKKVLLIDALSLFIRCYASFPSLNKNGEQVGGAVGFVKTLTKILDHLDVKKVIVVWESGGSKRRRAIFPDYKAGRKPEKLNRFYEDDLPDTPENREMQLNLLVKLLRQLPVHQVFAEDCEGDDVIAYLCRSVYPTDKKVIASSDHDMYQLIDPNTLVYNLHKKIFITKEEVYEQFRISAANFATAKAICGDKSDNIPGVGGVGFKSVAKIIPLLQQEEHILLSDVLDYCISNEADNRKLAKIYEAKDVVKRNWRLVYLDDGFMSYDQKRKIDSQLDKSVSLKRYDFIKQCINAGLRDLDADRTCSFFDRVS